VAGEEECILTAGISGLMRYLLFAPLLPIAVVIWLVVRRFYPKADPEEIYFWLFVSVIGAIVPSALIGVLCRILEGRGLMEMPSWPPIYAAGWRFTISYMLGQFYFDKRRGD
jgi:hypothetical protein